MTDGFDPAAMGDIVLLYDRDALGGDEAARDVLDQMDAIEAAWRAMGGTTARLAVDLRLDKCKARLQAMRPSVVVNLVESLDSADRLQTVVPMLLEEWRIPFTGSGSLAMHLSNNKPAAKSLLRRGGVATPDAAWLEDDRMRSLDGSDEGPGDWILKTRDSHASLFLDDDSIARNITGAALAERLRGLETRHGQAFFAERFVDGREFNLSVIERDDGTPTVLPPAEISFAGLPEGRPRIVGYAAKWHEESAEYQGTPRVFPGAEDRPLLDELSRIALEAWRVFGLSGYARIDFRVDAAGRPFVLEANANPCLASDAGFAAAAAEGGLSFGDMVARIVRAGLRHSSRSNRIRP